MATASVYGVELQARAMCPLYHPVVGTKDTHYFIVGTASSTADNKIHLLEYQEDTKCLECTAVWSSRYQITSLSPSPSMSGKSLLAASGPAELEILQLSDNLLTEPKSVLKVKKSSAHVLWDVDGLQSDIRVAEKGTISSVSLTGSNAGAETVCFSSEGATFKCAALAPYDPSLCMVSSDAAGLQLVDIRSKKATTFPGTQTLHGFAAPTALDFDKSKPGQFLSAGADGHILLHDIRIDKPYSLAPLQRIKAHDHNVHRCLFNLFHADLILSGSSDETQKLWDVAKNSEAKCLRRSAEFGDSVIDGCWSSTSPWVFAGLSYNGKVLVDCVPNERKMSILLEEKH